MSVDDRLTRDAPDASELDLDAVFAQIDATPPSRLDALRALGTPARRAALLVWLAAVGVLVVFGQELRPLDGALVAWVAVLALGGAWAVSAALRPLHRPPPAAPWLPAALVAALAVVIAISGVLPGMPETPEPAWPIHLGCWRATTLAAILAAIGGALVERGGGAAAWRASALAFGAGAAAFAFQTLACPVVDPVHVGFAHASAGLWVAAAWAAVRLLRASFGGQRRAP